MVLSGLAKALRPWMEQLAPCAEKLRPQVNGIMHELGRAADTVAHATAPALHALTDAAGPYVEVRLYIKNWPTAPRLLTEQ